ncbi:hypothetical protein SAMN05444722_0561 [Rhodovulum sp. ES.010]|uniref:hypothetical protein n=1 Tax=Rhodovulum sp. ES.010 TaxID=1882821 RepID=UPI00092B9021|nr:hypothetical protein [Rhodovulum sp. ES.010]SIO13572.1 hypothetical protein SAMN05444722_0561 [Rhodovulum sp. ES.010]
MGFDPLPQIERRAESLALRLELRLLIGICLLIGIGFLTAAAWLVLAAAHGAPVAATVLGSVYVALSALLFALVKRDPPAAPKQPESETGMPYFELAQGFAAGMQAGRAARNGAAPR